MSYADDTLKGILDDILSEHANSAAKKVDSAVDEEDEEIREMASESAGMLLQRLKAKVLEKLDASKGIEEEFEAAVFLTWRKPMDLMDLLLYLSLEVASEFNSEQELQRSSKTNCVQEALVDQHANACLIFKEIVHLLKSGFPSGAHSHWRALHEIACVSYFISEHGEDVAKRFLDYEAVENYYQAQAIYEHQQRMECETLSESDFKEIKKDFNKIKKRYGPDFVKKANYPYGWVPRSVLKTRSLKEIEKSVKLDMLRPFFDMTSYNVQGGPKGLMFKLGFMKNKEKNVVVPVGPSNYGLADPGKSAAISLGQVTACLLLAEHSFKNMVIVETLRSLVDEICDAFCEIQAEFGKASKSAS
jgi:hypothetical protein